MAKGNLAAIGLALLGAGMAASGCATGRPAAPTAPPTSRPVSPPPSVSAQVTLRRIGVEALCHAERRSNAIRLGGAQKDARIQTWLERQVAHEGLRRLALERLPEMTAAARAEALEELAAEVDLARCPQADLWRWRAGGDDGTKKSCLRACELRSGGGREVRAECRLGCETDSP